VKKGEFHGNIIFSCMKMEKWDLFETILGKMNGAEWWRSFI
jgi:hypothetical protein